MQPYIRRYLNTTSDESANDVSDGGNRNLGYGAVGSPKGYFIVLGICDDATPKERFSACVNL